MAEDRATATTTESDLLTEEANSLASKESTATTSTAATLSSGDSSVDPAAGSLEGGDVAFPTYSIHLLNPPFEEQTVEDIYDLLSHFGPQYHDQFGKDMRLRLACEPACFGGDGDGLEGLLCAVSFNEGKPVSVACIIFDPDNPEVGLLGHVITHPNHRRRGLAALVCSMVIEAFDGIGGSAPLPHTHTHTAAAPYPSLHSEWRRSECVLLSGACLAAA